MTLRKLFTSIVVISSFWLLTSLSGQESNQLTPTSTSITQGPEGQMFTFSVNLKAGIYTIQYSDDLSNWYTLAVEASDGFPIPLQQDINPIPRFYRVDLEPLENAEYASNELFSQLRERVAIEDLRSFFSLPATVTKPDTVDLSDPASLSHNDRLYAAALLQLARYASEQAALLPSLYLDYEAYLVTNIITDMDDGTMNGGFQLGAAAAPQILSFNATSEIESATETQAYSDAQWLEAFGALQNEVAGFNTVELDDSAGLNFSLPAAWGQFNWDSATWQ